MNNKRKNKSPSIKYPKKQNNSQSKKNKFNKNKKKSNKNTETIKDKKQETEINNLKLENIIETVNINTKEPKKYVDYKKNCNRFIFLKMINNELLRIKDIITKN